MKKSFILFIIPVPVFFILLLSFLPTSAFSEELDGEQQNVIMDELFGMDFDALIDLTITSASKKEEKLFATSAAVHVITKEDIRRSGHMSVPELLRTVPGLHVRRINANKWEISSRGLNDLYANKLLVLMDGRTVYTPLYGGVYWDVQDLVLEDIERIEVIRGPGAVLWGANAVNGIINIISKRSQDTQGVMITTGYGNSEGAFATTRYGGVISEELSYRIYAKYFDRNEYNSVSGTNGHDDWHVSRSGFRIDKNFSTEKSLIFQGDLYSGEEGRRYVNLSRSGQSTITDVVDISGGNLMLRYLASSKKTDYQVQFFYDYTKRSYLGFSEKRDTVDLDFQHRFNLTEQNEFTWGGGYRFTGDKTSSQLSMSAVPASRDDKNLSLFFQDKLILAPETLWLTLGTKFEENDYTGFEWQPGIRFSWMLKEKQILWAAVSRAVRVPTRLESNLKVEVNMGPRGSVVVARGNDNLASEKLIAYEVGYRLSTVENLLLEIALFNNQYQDLLLFVANSQNTQTYNNGMKGDIYGSEISTAYEVTPAWKLLASYSYLKNNISADSKYLNVAINPSNDIKFDEQQAGVRSYYRINRFLELDSGFYYLRGIPASYANGDFQIEVDSFYRFDLRIGWHPLDNLEASIVCQNLFGSGNIEASVSRPEESKIDRSLYGKITLRY
jgi:iron complex outermembrane recepter protein